MPAHAPFDSAPSARSGQLTLGDLGTPLSEVRFLVVDLETTGTSAGSSAITEIGAVRMRGGEIDGEFQTLVRPNGQTISPFVAQLTGITNAMVADAPELASALPAFLEFARGCVFVAHNAPFDIGFLRAACAELDYPWPGPTVLDTVTLARQVLPRPEVRNHRLSTLAAHFGTEVEPNHRALSDARATAEVLHRLLERFGSYGITTLEELATVRPQGWSRRRAKASLARDVPRGPGVYSFLDGSRRVLYVGSSSDMHARARSYFTAAETRGRMTEMVTAAQSVTTIPCSTELEARVREVRLIGELSPPYNRRSKRPDRACWLVLTDEPFPRLSLVRALTSASQRRIGPFRSHAAASAAKRVLERSAPLRTCAQRTRSKSFAPCAAGQMGRCAGPCAGDEDEAAYLHGISAITSLCAGDAAELRRAAEARMADLSRDARFEEAAEIRDGLFTLLRTTAREIRRSSLRAAGCCVFAERSAAGGWDLAVVEAGRLVAAGASPPGADPYATIAALEATREHVGGFDPAAPHTLDEETDIIAAWASSGTVRPVRLSEGWSQPVSASAAQIAGDQQPGKRQAPLSD